ncbi:molybdopterin-guanine dinucleotide biosynthesis protein B, partial [Lactiplantibacillus pentosus]|nr:molybdopterin-guanine dinucleotide biosynthesis protein B [Lactiplantibacillus pentosus]
ASLTAHPDATLIGVPAICDWFQQHYLTDFNFKETKD